MKEKNRYIHYGLVLTMIAFISALILAYTNKLTGPIIAENKRQAENKARIQVLPEATEFSVKVITIGDLEFIPGFNASNELVGYVVSGVTQGYAGPINFVLGFDKDVKITGLQIISSTETPGLGSRIANEEWRKLWIGRDSTHVFKNSEDGFAGATISPKAVYTRMMEILKIFKSEVK